MVSLSGGEHGGQEVDGTGWADGEVRDFSGWLYRRQGDQAVFIGMA
jgi:hypothetical protein